MGVLLIIFIALGLAALVGQILLYTNILQKDNSNWVFVFNTVLSMIISGIIFTGLPTNYISQKILAQIWGAIAILAYLFKLKWPQYTKRTKVMLSLSIIGGLAQLFFF